MLADCYYMELFQKYVQQIEQSMQSVFGMFGSPGDGLRSAVEYALTTGGKRIRPILVCMIAESLGKGYDVMDAAIALELIHTSTLIADDLPCMDDDDTRRGKPTVHIAYGESTALLASYALIPVAYELLRRNMRTLLQHGYDHTRAYAAYDAIMESVYHNIGVHGVLGGQYQDIFFDPAYDTDSVLDILHKKTGALFEIGTVAGWLYGGGSVEAVPILKRFAYSLGGVFQLADDFLDLQQDKNKSVGSLNHILLFGEEETRAKLLEQYELGMQALSELQAFGLQKTEELSGLLSFVKDQC